MKIFTITQKILIVLFMLLTSIALGFVIGYISINYDLDLDIIKNSSYILFSITLPKLISLAA